MLGFNKIIQVQPNRPQSSRTPLSALPNNENRNNYQTPDRRTHRKHVVSLNTPPLKRPAANEDGPPAHKARQDFVTPLRRPFLDTSNTQNAPLKKRPAELVALNQQFDTMQVESRKPREIPEVHLEDNDEDFSRSLFEEDDLYPANQLGLYDGGFGASNSQLLNETIADPTPKEKVGFERVNEDTIEMGGFILPGSEKKTIHKSYNWIAGRADGQYRVVLGYNTLFKVKNAVDSTTGEKDFNRWRVVRFENRYKENYPYTEFPAKYLEPLIQALEKAREQHTTELKDESVISN